MEFLLGGGGEETSLNDDLAQYTSSGENVFRKPFGAATTFMTKEGGSIRVCFTFDPHEDYDETAILASISTDYTDALREALASHLLQEGERAKQRPSEKEIHWETIRKMLPNEAFAKLDLTEYQELLKKKVGAVYREETLFAAALRNKVFSFCFKIAIDAFNNKSCEGPHERKGVLTFWIVGDPAKKLEPAPSSEQLEVPSNGTDSPVTDGEGRPRSRSQVRRHDRKELKKLMDRLGMLNIPEDTVTANEKLMPVTTDEFFDGISKWFQTVLSKLSAEVQNAPAQRHLYN